MIFWVQKYSTSFLEPRVIVKCNVRSKMTKKKNSRINFSYFV